LETTSSKATYISHTSQEEIIQCCKEEILFQIGENIREIQYFSIIFDETTDVSHISQMSLSIRNTVNECIGILNYLLFYYKVFVCLLKYLYHT